MTVSRSLTAPLLFVIAAAGVLYLTDANPLRVTALMAQESGDPEVINRGEDAVTEPAADVPSGGADEPFSADGGGAGPDPETQSASSDSSETGEQGATVQIPVGGARREVSSSDQDVPEEVASEPAGGGASGSGEGAPEQVASEPAGADAGEPDQAAAAPVGSDEPESIGAGDGEVAQGSSGPHFIPAVPFGVAENPAAPSDGVTADAGKGSQTAGKAKPEASKVAAPKKMPATRMDPQTSTITCFAGCGSGNDRPVYEGEMRHIGVGPQVKNAVAPAASGGKEEQRIECVAGCYQTPQSYPARKGPVGPSRAVSTGADRRT